MGHKILEVIIENGQLKFVDKKFPKGKIKAHLIYDVTEKGISEIEAKRIVKETSGVYKDIDIEVESKKLRNDWERNAYK